MIDDRMKDTPNSVFFETSTYNANIFKYTSLIPNVILECTSTITN